MFTLVNLDPEWSAWVQTNFSGVVSGRMPAAGAMDAHNTFAQPNALVLAAYSAGAKGAPLVPELPPKSIVVVAVPH